MSAYLFRKIFIAFFCATLFIGIAFIAIMPPFEGFDENAHYSRIMSTAYIVQAPFVSREKTDPRIDRLTAEIDDYQKIAPMPTRWLQIPVAPSEAKSHITPDYDFLLSPINGGDEASEVDTRNYKDFFADEKRVDSYIKNYRQISAAATYVPGREPNWEYQHPPAYYYVFAPVVRLLADHPLVDKIILMRIANYLLVMAALLIALRASFVALSFHEISTAREIIIFGMLFPFAAPCFWGEFGRLGNDNLCFLIFAFAWGLLLKHLRQPQAPSLWVGLGLVLGLGWWVKFTMVMVSGGIIFFLLMHHLHGNNKRTALTIRRRIFPVAIISAVCMVVGGSWYLYGYLSGQGQGSLEITWMLSDRDFLDHLHQNMTWTNICNGIDALLTTSVFSYPSLSRGVIKGLGTFSCVVMTSVSLAYFCALRRVKMCSLEALPLWVITPVLLMLLVHIAYSIIELDFLVTNGRYLQPEYCGQVHPAWI